MMSRLIIPEQPISFLGFLAVKLGVDRAIVIQQVAYMLRKSPTYVKGVQWIDRIHYRCSEQCIWWKESVVWGIVDSLIDTKHIVSDKFKQGGDDRTGALFTIDYSLLTEEDE